MGMKVVFPYFGEESGMLHYTSELANSLADVVEVYVLLRNHELEEYFGREVNIVELNSDIYNLLTNSRKHLSNIDPDIVHATSNHYLEILVTSFSRTCGRIFTIHNPYPHEGMEFLLYDYPAKKLRSVLSEALIVHGKQSKIDAVQRGYPENKLNIVNHGIYSRFKKFEESDEKHGEKMVLFFGSIRPNKGFDRITDISAKILEKSPNIRVVVAGNTETPLQINQEVVNDIAEELRQSNNLEFKEGYIPDTEVAELFSKATVLILPYYDGSQSGVAMIARAFETPIVATDVGDLPEIVSHGETGYIVKSESNNKISENALEIIEKEELRERMEHNISVSNSKYTWEEISKDIISVYKRYL